MPDTGLLDDIPIPVFIVDEEYRIAYLNHRMLLTFREHGYEAGAREALLGRSMLDFFPAEDHDERLANLQQIIVSGRGGRNRARVVLNARGERVTVVGSYTPIQFAGRPALEVVLLSWEATLPASDGLGGPPIRTRETPMEVRRGTVALLVLTPRQRQVALLVAQGFTTTNIAELLQMSEPTVRTHLRNIYRALGLSSRSGLTRLVLTGKR